MPVDLVYEVIHQRGYSVVLRRSVLTYGDGTRSIFTCVRVETGDRMEVEGLYQLLRQERFVQLDRYLNNGTQKVVLALYVGNFERLVDRMILGIE